MFVGERIEPFMLARLCKSLAVFFLLLGALSLPAFCGPNPVQVDPGVLPALKGLRLQGRLVFIVMDEEGSRLVELDLSSGKVRTLFTGAPRSWLASAEVSPDGKQILLAYAPPPSTDDAQFGFTDLSLLPYGSQSAPNPLLVRFDPNESFFQPTWAPDGQSIYFSHNAPSSAVPSGVEVRIERAVPGGEPQPLIDNAMWPRLSPDGTKIVYHSLKNEDMDNDLRWANVDGSNPRRVIPTDQPVIVDAMLFAPDGQSVYYSMAEPVQSLQGMPERSSPTAPLAGWNAFTWSLGVRLALGVRPVSAHSLPSDWYRVSLEDGRIQQVSHLQDYGMYAAFSPDGQWLAVVSQRGVIVMKPDGSQSTQIASLPAFGSVNWIR
jgi:Tol biopolymer transport system component